MRYQILSLIAALCLLIGCTIPVNQQHIAGMNAYIGKTEQQVIDGWGVPDKSYQMDSGTKVMTYTRSVERSYGGGVTSCVGNYARPFGYSNCFDEFPQDSVKFYCDYSFNIVKGTVRSWFQNGNNCPRIK